LPAVAASAEPVRTVTVDLATSKAPANADAEPASAPPVSQASNPPPTPVAAAPSEPASEPLPERGPPERAPPERAPIESSVPSPISRTSAARGEVSRPGGWAVQLGSFASRSNADNLVHQLKAQGFAVYVLSGGSGAATRHRVRVGPLADRDTAERTAAKLKALGHASSLVSPGA
jgi:cell division septation protein DedD